MSGRLTTKSHLPNNGESTPPGANPAFPPLNFRCQMWLCIHPEAHSFNLTENKKNKFSADEYKRQFPESLCGSGKQICKASSADTLAKNGGK